MGYGERHTPRQSEARGLARNRLPTVREISLLPHLLADLSTSHLATLEGSPHSLKVPQKPARQRWHFPHIPHIERPEISQVARNRLATPANSSSIATENERGGRAKLIPLFRDQGCVCPIGDYFLPTTQRCSVYSAPSSPVTLIVCVGVQDPRLKRCDTTRAPGFRFFCSTGLRRSPRSSPM